MSSNKNIQEKLEADSDRLETNQNLTEKMLERRQLLKILAASGAGLAAAAFIPEKWVKPVMKGGVIPAHAQTSTAPTATATDAPPPTDTPTPTATPIIHNITTCNAQNAQGAPFITPFDTISTFCIISPNNSGIQMRRRIILNQAGHPSDGLDLDNVTGMTDGLGQFTPPNFDLSSVTEITPGVDRISVRWEFVNSNGTGACVNLLELVDVPT